MGGRALKKVITYGTYDLFHIGHLNMLKRARALGDYLVVAISTQASTSSVFTLTHTGLK